MPSVVIVGQDGHDGQPRPNHLRVKLRAFLQRSLQRCEVHVDDAEAFGVAEGPFEVVEEGPDEVAADVGAL